MIISALFLFRLCSPRQRKAIVLVFILHLLDIREEILDTEET